MKTELSDVHSTEWFYFLRELTQNFITPPAEYDECILNHLLERQDAQVRVMWNEVCELWEIWPLEDYESAYPELVSKMTYKPTK